MNKIYWKNKDDKQTFGCDIRSYIISHNIHDKQGYDIEFIKKLYSVHDVIKLLFILDIASIIIPYTDCIITVNYVLTSTTPYNYSREFSTWVSSNNATIIISIIDSHNFLLDTYEFTGELTYYFKLHNIMLDNTFDVLNIFKDDNLNIKYGSLSSFYNFDLLELFQYYSTKYYNTEYSFSIDTKIKANIIQYNNTFRYEYHNSKYMYCEISIKNHKMFRNIMIILKKIMEVAVRNIPEY